MRADEKLTPFLELESALVSGQPNSVQSETYIRGNNKKKKIKDADFPAEARKTIPTSMKQAILSTPWTICPPSVLKRLLPLSSTNPVIAPRIMVIPSQRKSIARTIP